MAIIVCDEINLIFHLNSSLLEMWMTYFFYRSFICYIKKNCNKINFFNKRALSSSWNYLRFQTSSSSHSSRFKYKCDATFLLLLLIFFQLESINFFSKIFKKKERKYFTFSFLFNLIVLRNRSRPLLFFFFCINNLLIGLNFKRDRDKDFLFFCYCYGGIYIIIDFKRKALMLWFIANTILFLMLYEKKNIYFVCLLFCYYYTNE